MVQEDGTEPDRPLDAARAQLARLISGGRFAGVGTGGAENAPTPAPHGTRPVLAANQAPIFVYGCIRMQQYNKENVPPVPVFGKSTRELSGHTEENLGFV